MPLEITYIFILLVISIDLFLFKIYMQYFDHSIFFIPTCPPNCFFLFISLLRTKKKKQPNKTIQWDIIYQNKQSHTYKNTTGSILCLLVTPGHVACPGVCFIYPETIHWRKLISPYSEGISFKAASWLWVGCLYQFHPPQGLGIYREKEAKEL